MRPNHPITILHVINSFEVGGAETLLRNIIENWSDGRYELIAVSLIGKNSVLKGAFNPERFIDLSQDGKIDPLCFFRLIALMNQRNVRIVHTHDAQSGILARLCAAICGIRSIITTRHNPDLIGSHPILYRIENAYLRNAKKVIAISASVKDRLVGQYGIPSNNIDIVYNSIDLDFYRSMTGGNDKRQSRIGICTVARLTEQKGVDILIRAFAEVVKKHPDAVLDIAGDGPERKSLQKLSEDLNIIDRVCFLGSQNAEQVKDTLKNNGIFVLASRWEGFGISLIEAMAMGMTVIGSAVDGIKEIIEHNVNGLLFERENVQALAFQLLSVIEKPGMNVEQGIMARQTVEQRYDIRVYCKRLSEIYSEVIRTTH
jgi:glycosyltransferase involved in cell wall biosynthesis